MTKIFEITAITTNEEIESAIPFIDMREHAIERRDDAIALYEANGKVEPVLELHEIDGVAVLWSEDWAYAYVNQNSAGVGNSLALDNDEVSSPEEAAARWV